MGYYDEDYEPSEEELDQMEGKESTDTEFDFKNLKISFDVENFAKGIATAVKKTLKKEIIAELKESIIKDLKDDIQENIATISEEIVREVYENEKVVIGGWGEERQEVSVKQYLLNQIRESFKDGKFITKKKNRWGDVETTEVSIKEYINDKITFSAIQKDIDKEVDSIRRNINLRIKEMFDTSTRQMLSDNILQVLMANETYQKIQSNIACIADKKENKQNRESEEWDI